MFVQGLRACGSSVQIATSRKSTWHIFTIFSSISRAIWTFMFEIKSVIDCNSLFVYSVRFLQKVTKIDSFQVQLSRVITSVIQYSQYFDYIGSRFTVHQ